MYGASNFIPIPGSWKLSNLADEGFFECVMITALSCFGDDVDAKGFENEWSMCGFPSDLFCIDCTFSGWTSIWSNGCPNEMERR